MMLYFACCQNLARSSVLILAVREYKISVVTFGSLYTTIQYMTAVQSNTEQYRASLQYTQIAVLQILIPGTAVHNQDSLQ